MSTKSALQRLSEVIFWHEGEINHCKRTQGINNLRTVNLKWSKKASYHNKTTGINKLYPIITLNIVCLYFPIQQYRQMDWSR